LEALSFSQLQSLVEMTHPNVRSLGGNEVFLDGWNESYVVQSTMWNNLETRFFGITVGRVRPNYEMVASMLAAQAVCHHIGFARMIMDFQFIILYQL
jgi:hypothetical protein